MDEGFNSKTDKGLFTFYRQQANLTSHSVFNPKLKYTKKNRYHTELKNPIKSQSDIPIQSSNQFKSYKLMQKQAQKPVQLLPRKKRQNLSMQAPTRIMSIDFDNSNLLKSIHLQIITSKLKKSKNELMSNPLEYHSAYKSNLLRQTSPRELFKTKQGSKLKINRKTLKLSSIVGRCLQPEELVIKQKKKHKSSLKEYLQQQQKPTIKNNSNKEPSQQRHFLSQWLQENENFQKANEGHKIFLPTKKKDLDRKKLRMKQKLQIKSMILRCPIQLSVKASE